MYICQFHCGAIFVAVFPQWYLSTFDGSSKAGPSNETFRSAVDIIYNLFMHILLHPGLGVVLVAVVVVAWKCTPPGSEPIHALFNIGDSQSSRRERRPRRTHRPRDGQWHGGEMTGPDEKLLNASWYMLKFSSSPTSCVLENLTEVRTYTVYRCWAFFLLSKVIIIVSDYVISDV